jgi:Ca2+-binding EF-hand superfamily protein
MSRRGCSLPANASGIDPHCASITSRFGQVHGDATAAAPPSAATDADMLVETTVAVVREGLLRYDEKLPEDEVTRILAAGLGLPVTEAPFSDYRRVRLEDFVVRLRSIVVPRFSKPRAVGGPTHGEQFARTLPAEERQAIETAFHDVDTDFSGTLNAGQLREMIRRVYGVSLDAAELGHILRGVDGSASHAQTTGEYHSTLAAIHLEDLIDVMATTAKLANLGAVFRWRAAFRGFDGDDTGFVDQAELRDLIVQIVQGGGGGGVSDTAAAGGQDEQVATMMEQFSELGEDLISWPAFLDAMSAVEQQPTPVEGREA